MDVHSGYNDLWSLELGDSKDELKSVLVGSLPHGNRPNSDPWGLSMIWAKERFEFAPAHACVNELPVSSAWSKGIRVDTKLCQEWGMRQQFVESMWIC